MFKIAVPTYQRPEMLRRALESIVAQTFPNWQAFVFDDSPLDEAEQVVSAIGDPRIHYSRNPIRLGAAANIDRCFGARLSGLEGFGLVLEDDNFLLPTFLAYAAGVMQKTGARLVLFNQRIARGSTLVPLPETTRGNWFSEGWVDHRDLHASLLLMEGLSNGGIVWDLQEGIRLEVGPSVRYTALHEACRSLLVRERFWFSLEALAVWSALPIQFTARKHEANRSIGRGVQALTQFVLRDDCDCVMRGLLLADTEKKKTQLVIRLLHAGHLTEAFRVDVTIANAHLGVFIKGLLLRLIMDDPCSAFLKQVRTETATLSKRPQSCA